MHPPVFGTPRARHAVVHQSCASAAAPCWRNMLCVLVRRWTPARPPQPGLRIRMSPQPQLYPATPPLTEQLPPEHTASPQPQPLPAYPVDLRQDGLPGSLILLLSMPQAAGAGEQRLATALATARSLTLQVQGSRQQTAVSAVAAVAQGGLGDVDVEGALVGARVLPPAFGVSVTDPRHIGGDAGEAGVGAACCCGVCAAPWLVRENRQQIDSYACGWRVLCGRA